MFEKFITENKAINLLRCIGIGSGEMVQIIKDGVKIERQKRAIRTIEGVAGILRQYHDTPEVAHSTRTKTKYMPRVSYVTEQDGETQNDVFWMKEFEKTGNILSTEKTTVVVLEDGHVVDVGQTVRSMSGEAEPISYELSPVQQASALLKLARELQNPLVVNDLAQTTNRRS